MSDEEVAGEKATSDPTFDPTLAGSGARRSTFTPPPGGVAKSVFGLPDVGDGTPTDAALHDDDELASALRDDFSRVAPPTAPVGTLPVVIPPVVTPPVETPSDMTSPVGTPPDVTSQAEGPKSWGESVQRADTELGAGTDADIGRMIPPVTSAATDARPWLSAAAPNPANAVNLPGGPLMRPVRRSLPDDQLQALVETAGQEPGGTLGVIEELESQLKLREAESRQFSAWQTSMLALGTPDAVAAVERVSAEFADVVQVTPTGPRTLPSAERAETGASQQGLPQDQGSASASFEPQPLDEPPAFDEPPMYVEPPTIEPPMYVEPQPLDEPPTIEPPMYVEPPTIEPPVAAEPSEQWTPPDLVEPLPFGVPATFAPTQEPDFTAPTPEFSAPPPFNFDDLLPSAPDGVPGEARGGEPASIPQDNIFMMPMAVAAGAPQPTDTGSVRVIEPTVQAEFDDEVDETDRAFPGVLSPGAAGATAGAAALFASQQISPPSAPIAITRIPDDEIVIADSEPVRQRVFGLEASGLEPTPIEQRTGRSVRLFWLWFAANSSILSIALGATIFGLGMSLRQAIVAVLAGVALSFLPLGLTTLAGKRSGQPTMVVSRATFGLVGNLLPAIFALVTRVFWGAVLLWLFATSAVIVLVGAGLDGGLTEALLLFIALAIGLVVAGLIAVAGYALLARIQLILSIITAVLLIGLVALTASYIDIEQALTTPDGPWILSVTGAVLVFSFVGLVWAHSGADLARYQRPGTSGASSMLWATFGATLPSFLIIGYGALLAASDAGIATGFATSPLDTLALMLPTWYPVPLLAAVGLSLLSGLTITLYSGSFAFQAFGMRLPRPAAVGLAALVVAAIAVLIAFGGIEGIAELFRDVATSLAVPTAAWAGIFAAELMIRNRRFETASLLARGGVYPSVRWVNLVGLLVISAIGFGLTSATVSWLGWQGYLFSLLGIPLETDLAGTDLGVLVALVLGLLVPIAFGIPSIRRQEAARV